LLIRWPGVTPAGAQCQVPVVLMDLFHTLRAVGAPTDAAEISGDGLDLRPLLMNPAAKLERDALYFHYPHYYDTTTPVGAVRAGDWKLLEYFEDDRVELFNLASDPGEAVNLVAQQPEKARALRERLQRWRQTVNAAMPQTNPDFHGRTD
jgi:arylsulfatase A-like enzyme